MPKKAAYNGPMSPDEAQVKADAIRARPEFRRLASLDDLILDAMAGIAHGATDPQEIARVCLRLGAEVYGDEDAWITWEKPAGDQTEGSE